MNKKAYAFFLKNNRRKKPPRKNPIAETLKFFTPKVKEDKTKYDRKKINQKSFWKGL